MSGAEAGADADAEAGADADADADADAEALAGVRSVFATNKKALALQGKAQPRAFLLIALKGKAKPRAFFLIGLNKKALAFKCRRSSLRLRGSYVQVKGSRDSLWLGAKSLFVEPDQVRAASMRLPGAAVAGSCVIRDSRIVSADGSQASGHWVDAIRGGRARERKRAEEMLHAILMAVEQE